MADMSAIASALASLNAAKDIAQAMIGLRDTAAFQEKRLEFQSKILDAQNSAFAANEERTTLIDRVRKLEKELADLKAWETERQRYELQSVYYGGAFTYALKPNAKPAEPPHWICATCYEKGHKSVLQRGANPQNGVWPFVCPACKAVIFANHEGPGQQQKMVRGEECPKCRTPNFQIEKSQPDPQFGELGAIRRQMKCASCGFEESRLIKPSG